MSGLVNGLQNRLRRFESARHLKKAGSSVKRTSGFLIICQNTIDLCQKDNKKKVFSQIFR